MWTPMSETNPWSNCHLQIRPSSNPYKSLKNNIFFKYMSSQVLVLGYLPFKRKTALVPLVPRPHMPGIVYSLWSRVSLLKNIFVISKPCADIHFRIGSWWCVFEFCCCCLVFPNVSFWNISKFLLNLLNFWVRSRTRSSVL